MRKFFGKHRRSVAFVLAATLGAILSAAKVPEPIKSWVTGMAHDAIAGPAIPGGDSAKK